MQIDSCCSLLGLDRGVGGFWRLGPGLACSNSSETQGFATVFSPTIHPSRLASCLSPYARLMWRCTYRRARAPGNDKSILLFFLFYFSRLKSGFAVINIDQRKMGVQRPPSIFLMVMFGLCFVFSVVFLSLSSYGGGRQSAAAGTGIVGGVFGLLGAIFGVFWLLFTELYAPVWAKWMLVVLLAVGATFSIISGILWAIATNGAASAFGFINSITCVITIVFVFQGVRADAVVAVQGK